MTDYFALLNQPQRPWLDEEELKRVYHEKTLATHPDANRDAENSSDFADLNDAYRTLRDPRARLQHLLELHGASRDLDTSVPHQLEALFPAISSGIADGKSLLAKIASAQNALTRGLIAAEVLRRREQIEQLLRSLSRMNEAALADLRQLDREWDGASVDRIAATRELSRTFAYLSRWMRQLEEIKFGLEVGS